MKKILLLLMLLLPLSASAQLTYDVKAGVFQAGVDISYEFERHWVLSAGLTFAQTRSTLNLTDGTSVGYFFPQTDVKLNHLMIPLKVGYNIRFCKNFSLIPSVGWYGSLDFNAGESSLASLKREG